MKEITEEEEPDPLNAQQDEIFQTAHSNLDLDGVMNLDELTGDSRGVPSSTHIFPSQPKLNIAVDRPQSGT